MTTQTDLQKEKKTSFVFFKAAGGLGNQMFEYAASYAVAKLNNAQIYVQNCPDNHHNKIGHNYAQKLFRSAIECEGAPGPCHSFYDKDFYPWDPKTVSVPCQMLGHFQYYPVIQPVLDDLINEFCESLSVKERTNAVFLHIRRGDYVAKSHFHYLQGPEYYLMAFQQLISKMQALPEKVLIFSDDIPWCRQQPWLSMIPNVEFFEEEDELKSLAAMASCGGGAIIANSTFSWWGAILSKTQHVYYPSRWIGCPVYDLFPSNWVCIPT